MASVKPAIKPKPGAKPVTTSKPAAKVNESVVNTDSFGNYLKADVRENEEQFEKLAEIIEILVAAGYFRARIKGLSDFDKIVGGMCWCLEMADIDVDCDLLFNDSLTIGQKIALTEKIVRVLQAMECPFRLEPHQIQGMDCIHIFPVVQWLVKTTIRFREAMHDYTRRYAVTQFNKTCVVPEKKFDSMEAALKAVDVLYEPVRKYRHPAKYKITEERKHVQTTLLEYGETLNTDSAGDVSNAEQDSGQTQDGADPRIVSLANEMSEEASVRVSPAVIGTIITNKADEISVLAQEYALRRKELEENDLELQQNSRQAKVQEMYKAIEKAKAEAKAAEDEIEKLENEIDSVKQKQNLISPKAISDEELEERRCLLLTLESLKSQKTTFLDFCENEKGLLEKQLNSLAGEKLETEDENRVKLAIEKDGEKLKKVKLHFAEKNKALAVMLRKLDDIPSRAELSQYQKRFYELYNQVSAKHNETKKFYVLYNQLDDTKINLNKELNLLNSILTNFNQASSNPAAREQFITQLEQIVGNIKQAKQQVEKRRQMEKLKKDQLNEQYVDLVEKQRLYCKAVKEFKEECRKNEQLIAELQKLSA